MGGFISNPIAVVMEISLTMECQNDAGSTFDQQFLGRIRQLTGGSLSQNIRLQLIKSEVEIVLSFIFKGGGGRKRNYGETDFTNGNGNDNIDFGAPHSYGMKRWGELKYRTNRKLNGRGEKKSNETDLTNLTNFHNQLLIAAKFRVGIEFHLTGFATVSQFTFFFVFFKVINS